MRTFISLALVFCLVSILNAQEKKPLPTNPAALSKLLFSDADFDSFTISPGSKYLALSVRKDKDYRMVTMDLANRKSGYVQLRSGEYPLFVEWVDQDSLTFATGKWGIYYATLYGMHTKTNRFHDLDMDQPTYVLNTLPQIEDRALVYTNTKKRPFPDVYMLNTDDNGVNNLTPIVKNPGNINYWLADSAGVVRVGVHKGFLGQPLTIMYREGEKAKWRTITLPSRTHPLELLSNGKTLLVSSKQDKEQYGLYLYDIEKEAITRAILSIDGYGFESDTVDFIRDSNTYNLVGIKVQRQKPTFVYFSQDYGNLQKSLLGVLPDKTIDILGINEELQEAYFMASADNDPGSLYVPNLKAGEIGRIITRYPGLAEYELATTEPIIFEARDGFKIHGYLTMPTKKQEGPPPLVALVHGGPWARDTWGYDPEVQMLAALGYAVLQVNYRGSSGYTFDYSEINLEEILKYSVEDVADGVRWAISEGKADASKIAIMGASFGGYVSTASLALEKDLYKCSVSFAGVYDWPEMQKSDEDRKYISPWLKEAYVLAEEALIAYSPVNLVSQMNAPLLLLHGKADGRVDYTQSSLMKKALKKAGVQFESETFNWVGHGFAEEKSRIKYYEKVATFLQKHLGS